MKAIIIYTKNYCGYCHAAKSLLEQNNMSYEVIEVDRDMEKLQEMYSKSQRRTVPQIFFDNEHIGGYTDLVRYLENFNA